ncbi:hypothetical protein A2Z00_01020 [Candidatus Gottesmanbacteria bacterium RBG_13_45_10]|uniref:Uncharacterized protein n=1 Tax=Candidatus Gottesmanbacteria bacterium RBG_13_45_10 TaxID=1798370 RepID=A0A1F5ZHP6_9BACT|nr:MAG: hypothetical protein A2Z00_01020 [Candidatus Gottesmanbacteria bacterium RBG_13_45_10]
MDNDRDLLLISVFTFLTVSLWITFELLKTIKTTTVSSPVQQIVIPLDPKIDIETLTTVVNRKVY